MKAGNLSARMLERKAVDSLPSELCWLNRKSGSFTSCEKGMSSSLWTGGSSIAPESLTFDVWKEMNVEGAEH